MTHDEAVAFLTPAGPWRGRWADVGAGTGTFTHALAELIGPEGTVYAIERDPRAVAELQLLAGRTDPTVARISALRGDMHELSSIAEIEGAQFHDAQLDGILFANVLHFTGKPEAVLAQAAELLRPDGRVVVIEYDRRMPNPWVPHPLPWRRLLDVADKVGAGRPVEVARRASMYQGEIYCAVLDAPVDPSPQGS